MLDYVIIGMLILLFIFELLIIWYLWWIYSELNNEMNDTQDMIVDIYHLQILQSEENTNVNLPKRVKTRLDRRRN